MRVLEPGRKRRHPVPLSGLVAWGLLVGLALLSAALVLR